MSSRRMPCEMVVFELLPTARGEIAKDLVVRHGYTQSSVAKIFGITSAAVSQYLKGLRGGNVLIDNSRFRNEFYEHIMKISDNLSNGADFAVELCALCSFFKKSGMIDEIYYNMGSTSPLTKCMECPKTNL